MTTPTLQKLNYGLRLPAIAIALVASVVSVGGYSVAHTPSRITTRDLHSRSFSTVDLALVGARVFARSGRPAYSLGASGAGARTPTIAATILPAPNAAGWNNVSATVVFSCTDASGGCTAPVSVSQEGTNQVIEGHALDGLGGKASTSATVDLDKTSPTVSITSPASGSTTNTSLTVSGAVADALSGIAFATCNGEEATITSGNTSCDVELRPGVNTIVLVAVDVAGNSASDAIRITRTGTASGIYITPNQRRLMVGTSKELSLVDNFGQPVTGASWSSDTGGVATVAAAGSIVTLTAVAAGDATITATIGGLSAELDVTVATTIAVGEAHWQSTPTDDGYFSLAPIRVARTTENAPDIWVVESDANGVKTARALTSEGEQLWIEPVPGELIMGDVYGGVISLAWHSEGDTSTAALYRLGSPDLTPWSYRSRGVIGQSLAQGPDGVLYFAESIPAGPFESDGFIVVLNGSTGATIARIPFPRSYNRVVSTGVCSGTVYYGGGAGTPSIGKDGKAYTTTGFWGETTYTDCVSGATQVVESWSKLVKIEPDGSYTTADLDDYSYSGTYQAFHDYVSPGNVLPDSDSGILVSSVRYSATNQTSVTTIHRFVGASSSTYDLAPGETLRLTGPENRAYAVGENVRAFDATDGSTEWSYSGNGQLIDAVEGGGIVLLTAEGIVVLDENGDEISAGDLPAGDTVTYSYWSTGRWFQASESAVGFVEGPAIDNLGFGFVDGQGNAQRQNAPTKPIVNYMLPVTTLNPNVSPPYTTIIYEAALKQHVTKVTHLMQRGSAATREAFVKTVQQPGLAFVVIGHAEMDPQVTGNPSVGLVMSNGGVMKVTTPLQVYHQTNGSPDPSSTTIIETIPSQARIVFVSSCKVGTGFEQWWNIGSNTNRFLIVPDNHGILLTDLYAGAVAWFTILNALEDGATVADAVGAANTLLNPNGGSSNGTYKVIGRNGGVGIRVF